jgi:hypothetical protein
MFIIKRGSKGKYPQEIEFDESDNLTDHSRPEKHPNPHQYQIYVFCKDLSCSSQVGI